MDIHQQEKERMACNEAKLTVKHHFDDASDIMYYTWGWMARAELAQEMLKRVANIAFDAGVDHGYHVDDGNTRQYPSPDEVIAKIIEQELSK